MNDTKNNSDKSVYTYTCDVRLQNTLDGAARRLKNPIVLIDLSYNLLCHTENKVTDDPLWNELVTLGSFSHDTVDFFNSEKFIEAFAKTECVALMKSPKLKYDRASCTLFNESGVQIGSFCVVACNKPFEDSDFELMETVSEELSRVLSDIAEICKLPIATQDTIVDELQDTFIGELIEGRNIANEDAMNMLYEGLKKNFFVAVIDIIQYDKTLTHLVYFKNLFSKIKGDFKYFTYLNNIVAIMSTDSPLLSVNNDLKELNDFFSHYMIYAGISGSFQNLGELRKYFKQALNALNFGVDLNDGKNIYFFTDFMLEAFIKEYPEKLLELCHPMALVIYDYDKKNETNYKDIFYNYIYYGQNIGKAAEKMNINQDDYAVHLTNIEQLFDIDFGNMNMLFSLFCCMKLHKHFPEKFA